MNDDILQDLEQFIAVTVSQQTSDLRRDMQIIRGEIQSRDEKLTAKIDELSSPVAEALENTHEANATQLHDHEQRMTRLEQGAS